MLLEQKIVAKLPALPAGQSPMDVIDFRIGKAQFFWISSLNEDRTAPSISRFFRVSDSDDWTKEPELILSTTTYHPRNLAIGPEVSRKRWVWIADHGPDVPPFPGGRSSLYRISEQGEVETFSHPLLEELKFSFDGAIWADASRKAFYLYQSNIGGTAPRLLRWKKSPADLEDLSEQLPQSWRDMRRRFLVSRKLPGSATTKGIILYMGADTSEPAAERNSHDVLARFGHDGRVSECPAGSLPRRLKKSSWSTVEVLYEDFDQDEKADLLALYHDERFAEGAAEVLWRSGSSSFVRKPVSLSLSKFLKENVWIARAAIGNLFGSGRQDIALYLRGTTHWDERGPAGLGHNLVIFQNLGRRRFKNVTSDCQIRPGTFIGGFFSGKKRNVWLQFDIHGNIEMFRLAR